MTLAAAELYPEFVAELEAASGVATGYERIGALHVALDRDEAAELRRVHDLQRSLGLDAEWLPPRRCRELEPGLTPSFNGGVHAPGEAAVDPRALTAALLAALGREGVEVRTGCEVVGGLSRASGSRGADRGGEELRADAVVLATGAWAGRAEWLPEHARPPVRPVKGEVLELRPARRRAALRADRRLRARLPGPPPRRPPDRRRHRRGAGLRHRGHRRRRPRAAARGLPAAARGRRDGAGRARSPGLRPGTPDNLPLVGPGAIEGLVLADRPLPQRHPAGAARRRADRRARRRARPLREDDRAAAVR